MKVIHDIAAFPNLSHAVVTSGTFDGVHVGHQKILNRLVEVARKTNGQSVVITYWPHPRLVLFPEATDLQLLSTIDERIEQLEAFGIDYLLIIPFTKEFSQLDSRQYITDILINTIGTKKLVIGYDHRFGKNREGSFEHLKANAGQYGFEVEEIPREDIDDIGVSSTKIRKALLQGDVEHASKYLGRPYSLTGSVAQGAQLGRTIGFPTANIQVPEKHKLIPGNGVYAVSVSVADRSYNGMLNIGVRPTVEGVNRTIEVHILDFDKDIYDQTITVAFLAYLRPEQKFENLEALKAQIMKDKERAKKIFSS